MVSFVKNDKTAPLMSVIRWRYEGAVVYVPGVYTLRVLGNGPLSVFNKKESAITFAVNKGWFDTYLYKCRYVPSGDSGLWCHYRGGKRSMMDEIPYETVFAEKVMLLKKDEWIYT